MKDKAITKGSKGKTEVFGALTATELEVIDRLREAYPRPVDHTRLMYRTYYTNNGMPGEWHEDPFCTIAIIRRKLGMKAVETVYEYRIGSRGIPVRGPRVGYRLGPALTGSI